MIISHLRGQTVRSIVIEPLLDRSEFPFKRQGKKRRKGNKREQETEIEVEVEIEIETEIEEEKETEMV